MLSDDEVRDLIKQQFGEEINVFNDYGPGDLVRAFWVGYKRAVTDSRPAGEGEQ